MYEIKNSEKFRENVRIRIEELIKEKKIVKNVEKSIFNYSIKEADNQNIVKKWDNKYFTIIYIDRLRSIMKNLKNENFYEKVCSKEIKPERLASISHIEMNPDKWKDLINKKKIRQENLYSPKLEANTDNFTCRKCNSKQCSYYQLQTRSADEPMTTFVTCINCGNRWKC